MSTSSPKFDVHDRVRFVTGPFEGEAGRIVSRHWNADQQTHAYMVEFDWDIDGKIWATEKKLERV